MITDFQELQAILLIPRHPFYEPMTFQIKRSLLPKQLRRHRYMYNDGEVDYLGQFLVQLGYNIQGKYRTPQDLGKLITPFTQACRGYYINSKLTIDILELDMMPTHTHPQKLAEILERYNYKLVFVK